jgi:hypothetical protein
LVIANVYPQKITSNPDVDDDCSNEASVNRITSVVTGIGEENFTLVTFQFVTTLFKPWIRMDSKTFLTTNRSKTKYKILGWGIFIDNDNEPFSPLNFDEQYSVKKRTAYNLYMLFPGIPENATLLHIEQLLSSAFLLEQRQKNQFVNGWYWRGIHINNETTKDLSKNNSNYSQRGKFTPSGSGSGFAISANGYIATCYHIIENAKEIRIKGVNGNFNTSLKAKVSLADAKNDLAILKIDGIRFSQIPYSLEPKLSDVGEEVFVLGYPQIQHLGEEVKLTTGVISARSGYRGDITTYQISAQALPGNSGCPLFNHNGNIIGIVNAKYIEPNVSYAVKLFYLNTLIENSEINLTPSVNNTISDKSLADKVKSIQNFVYIIEVEQ